MSDDDDLGDVETESAQISDVNPEEMARLMADLDDMDDPLFKSENVKRLSSKDFATDTIGKKSFQSESKANKKEDGWDDDANDLLNSANTTPVKKKPNYRSEKLNTTIQDSSTQKKDLESKTNSETAISKSPTKVTPTVEKRKLISDLFGEDKTENNTKEPEKSTRKLKPEVHFDDESNPLDMNSKSKPSDSGFLDSLLGKSSLTKPERKISKEFVIPKEYKNMAPDKSTTPERKQKVEPSFEDFFGDSNSRPRRTSANRRNKSFDIDDDDILGSTKGKQKSSIQSDESKKRERKQSKDDWLFGTPQKASQNTDEDIRTTEIIEGKSSADVSPEKRNWLNNLLTSSKSSPSKQTFQANSVLESSRTAPQPSFPADGSSQIIGTTATATQNISQMFNGVVQNQITEHQSKLQGDVAAMTSLLQMQQQKAEAELINQLRIQMQEQQQRFSLLMAQQNQKALANIVIPKSNPIIEDEEAIKQLKIDLHKAQTEVGRLEAELGLLKTYHQNELDIVKESQLKKESLEEEINKRKDEIQVREKKELAEKYQIRIEEMQREKDMLIKSYEVKLCDLRTETAESMQRSKEMYSSIIERMKKEHLNAVERLTELKEIEIRATLDATGRVKEAESVLNQLESNTADLSELTTAINQRHESAFELTKKSLEIKEKQLKNLEANLGIVKAESESERNRLTILVNRLESSLSNQGTEVESHKWTLAQDKMKLDSERTSLIEEKRHFQLNMDTEKRELERCREAILREQKLMIQTISRQKFRLQDLESRKTTSNMIVNTELEIYQFKEDQRNLEEKMKSLKFKRDQLMEEEGILEEKQFKIEEEISQNNAIKEMLDQKSLDIEYKSKELEKKEDRLERERKVLDIKLSEISQSMNDLHHQRDLLTKQRLQLQMEEASNSRILRNLCYTCLTKIRSMNSSPSSKPLGRIPGDGREIQEYNSVEQKVKSLDATSVLNRLKQAREEELRLRVKKEELKVKAAVSGLN